MPLSEEPQQKKDGPDFERLFKGSTARLRNHIKDMDARIALLRDEIRIKSAAADQLEFEKLKLSQAIDAIEAY
jgi:hypothetical protein